MSLLINKLKKILLIGKPEKYYDKFKLKTYKINIYRGKVVGYLFIFLEIILTVMSFINSSYHLNRHIVLYLIMIFVMLVYIVIFKRLDKNVKSIRNMRLVEIVFTGFMLLWGAAVSLLDQFSYGQIAVYVVTLMAVAVIPILEPLISFFLYFSVQAVFIIALPYFQKSAEIASDHILNSVTFAIVSWVISRLLFKSNIETFLFQIEIQEKNEELRKINKRLEKANEELKKLSNIDSLTGVFNRRKFKELVEFKWEICLKHKIPITVIMIDIDYFKEYNDHYGHVAGDKSLRYVASVLSDCVKGPSDIMARYGGEEFIIVMSGISKKDAEIAAENMRNKVESLGITHDFSKASKYLTISLGVYTTVPSLETSIEKIIQIADNALYEAKMRNKNRVVTA